MPLLLESHINQIKSHDNYQQLLRQDTKFLDIYKNVHPIKALKLAHHWHQFYGTNPVRLQYLCLQIVPLQYDIITEKRHLNNT